MPRTAAAMVKKTPAFATARSRVLLAAVAVACALTVSGAAFLRRSRAFLPDTALDVKTFVAPSTIPGAGDGLFAARDLSKGEAIAELGGQPVFEEGFAKADRGYLFAPPPCATLDVWPFDALDARVVGGRASKINFAPRTLNGLQTQLQNAEGKVVCRRPYVVFEATRNIPRGAEILTSYGADYDYGFMAFPEVQAHFCLVAKIDCAHGFAWEP